jgi:hypothetical protein
MYTDDLLAKIMLILMGHIIKESKLLESKLGCGNPVRKC